jgi:hypothetical protein
MLIRVKTCLSQWLRGLRRGSAAAHLLGLRIRISPGSWMSVVSVVCCQVEFLRRSPTDCGMSERDR